MSYRQQSGEPAETSANALQYFVQHRHHHHVANGPEHELALRTHQRVQHTARSPHRRRVPAELDDARPRTNDRTPSRHSPLSNKEQQGRERTWRVRRRRRRRRRRQQHSSHAGAATTPMTTTTSKTLTSAPSVRLSPPMHRESHDVSPPPPKLSGARRRRRRLRLRFGTPDCDRDDDAAAARNKHWKSCYCYCRCCPLLLLLLLSFARWMAGWLRWAEAGRTHVHAHYGVRELPG